MFYHQMLLWLNSVGPTGHASNSILRLCPISIFRTSDISVIAYCREMFQFDLPSAILKKRAEKFDSPLLN